MWKEISRSHSRSVPLPTYICRQGNATAMFGVLCQRFRSPCAGRKTSLLRVFPRVLKGVRIDQLETGGDEDSGTKLSTSCALIGFSLLSHFCSHALRYSHNLDTLTCVWNVFFIYNSFKISISSIFYLSACFIYQFALHTFSRITIGGRYFAA
jgi:hypothetical protein